MEWSRTEIKRRRETLGLSQQELADAVGVSRRAVTNWETGVAEPRGKSLRRLDQILGDRANGYDPRRSEMTIMELLGELASRIAQLEARSQGRPRPNLPPERVVFPTRLIHTTSGRQRHGEEGEKGNQAL